MTRRPIPFEDACSSCSTFAVAHAHGSVAGPLGVRFRLGGAGLARELDQLFAGVEQVHPPVPPTVTLSMRTVGSPTADGHGLARPCHK